MSYTYQKLKNAVEALQGNTVSKRQWLESNDVYHVLHLSLEEFPHDVREDFSRLRCDDIIIRMKQSLSGQIDVARAISEEDVERLAGQIVELYYHVDTAMFSRAHQPRRTSAAGDGSASQDM